MALKRWQRAVNFYNDVDKETVCHVDWSHYGRYSFHLIRSTSAPLLFQLFDLCYLGKWFYCDSCVNGANSADTGFALCTDVWYSKTHTL